jgi:hypothetical protein
MSHADSSSVVSNPLVRKPGRPPLYTEAQRAAIASLVASYGLTGAQRALRAANGTPEASYRDAAVFPEACNISIPTIAKIAKDNGIKLARGPRKVTVSVPVNQTTATEPTDTVAVEDLATL